MIEIKNLPPYHEKYVVAMAVDTMQEDGAPTVHWWYWGSFDEEEKAYDVADSQNRAQVFVRDKE